MTREEISKLCLEESDKHKCLLLELSTGTGKTKQAIDLTNHICDRVFRKTEEETDILIIVAKKVHKDNWLKEIEKWGGINSSHIIIECYESLKKYEGFTFDVCIADEVHHLSDLRKEILSTIKVKELLIGLSATIPNELKAWFKDNYDTSIISCDLQEAIEDGVLPEPTIYLIPLYLDNSLPTEVIIKNPKAKGEPIECSYAKRWQYITKRLHRPIKIHCTKAQYLYDLNQQIEWYKKKARSNKFMEAKWLRLCGERLKWLSDKKTDYVLHLLDKFKNYRTITFCNSIEQTELLGKNCIHSKNKDSQEILDKFNNKKIKHITSCQMLNEGVNLSDCRIGIYANINASETINTQRQGRLLRHKHPIIIIPFYKNTREEEIVKDIIKDYNPELIKVINNFNTIKL